MIDKLIDFSVRHKWLVIILTAASLVLAIWSMKRMPLDALPDMSDTQVIIYSRWDRPPDIIEDQVTYPIVSALLGTPNVKAVRGFSDFGFSYVYVIFKDGTDIYWARSRVLEYLSKILPKLPEGVKTELGPDATGVGWVFQYALVDKSGTHDLAELRTFQDWYMRYYLQSVPGVAEVAPIGGFVKQYQVITDPRKLAAYQISLSRVIEAVRASNKDAGGRLLEISGAEFMVRSRGLIKSVKDLEQIALGSNPEGNPILLKHVASVRIGADIRRGVSDLDGLGDTVGGTVVMRFGENALEVINRVKQRLEEIKPSLPKGVEVEITYDRSDLIKRSIDNLRHQLIEEMIIVSAVILLFLWHFPSAFIPIITIPIAVVLSFIPLFGLKVTTNIMSMAGIAISIGVLVDGAIVQMENVYKHLEIWHQNGRREDYRMVVLKAMKEVGPSVFFSLLVIAVSFLPIFTLIDQEGKLFTPMAFSKTFAMAIAAILAVTFNPALRMLLLRVEPYKNKAANALLVGQYYPEEKHPVSRVLFKLYEPVCRFVLHHPRKVILSSFILFCSTIPVFMKLGSEFMPPLWEGSILYMPVTLPGISVTEAQRLLTQQDKILKSFPQVDKVWGKAGRVESSTDPAPFSMMETVVLLKPEDQWPQKIPHQELIEQMDQALKIPGSTNAWTMPIKNRIDMLTTGIRTPVGIKISGADLKVIEDLGMKVERALKGIPGTRSVFAERVSGGYFIDIDIKRDALARYGLSVDEVQMVISSAVGGEEVTSTIEGRERYGVNVRYPRHLRDNPDALNKILVTAPGGQQVPLKQLADISLRLGPAMIRNENGMTTGYVYVDTHGTDIGRYVDHAKQAIAAGIEIPSGYTLTFSGQYENMQRVKERLKFILPLTLFVIIFLLYMNTQSMVKTGIVLLAVPFSLIGAVWLLWLLDYNMSIAVWVGIIALLGLDAETGVLFLLFMDIAYKDYKARGQLNNEHDLKESIVHGSVRRLRPKMMTVMAAMIGLLPIMFADGAGSDVMKRIAAPMIGGLATSFILELCIYPAIYLLWRQRELIKPEHQTHAG